MSAYVIADVEVTNAEGYEEYRRQTPATIAAYDGKFIVRGGIAEVFEGDWRPHRLVVIQFPSVERARQWLDSPEYSAIKGIRHRNARTSLIVVEGVA
jgi:uncharacterized protein (DUF1330 family)